MPRKGGAAPLAFGRCIPTDENKASKNMHARIVFPSDDSAINSVSADAANAPVEYFSLQGVRVTRPAAGQVVIRRQGADATKVVF
ncbi:MAG TPA: hypothetical protein DCR26_07335 [Porphyromonadaceae bacterium]|nr:hypothetical protein [Porphyromonadaceae bacterium]